MRPMFPAAAWDVILFTKTYHWSGYVQGTAKSISFVATFAKAVLSNPSQEKGVLGGMWYQQKGCTWGHVIPAEGVYLEACDTSRRGVLGGIQIFTNIYWPHTIVINTTFWNWPPGKGLLVWSCETLVLCEEVVLNWVEIAVCWNYPLWGYSLRNYPLWGHSPQNYP